MTAEKEIESLRAENAHLREVLAEFREKNTELRVRNIRLHQETHILRMRLNYPLATTDQETLKELERG